ncbi:SDR family oxidoreductase [Glaciihabitans arcticus]|uniref:SDR family oxidoreductase n=1 Tax=Glaciihabitans arcticus TaxID=2668039 RepID=A0A4Q9GV76_9MICO|nr:SDR family oxidoreductase [Glaciihabitans arcticus]TBN57107.1 SDR family oxidoreductase [Glaciihabitans arcticus]
MTILVTGASGHLGRLAIEALLERGIAADTIVAGARRPEVLAELAARGIHTVELDYTKPDTIAAALDGVDHLLLVSSSVPGSRVAEHTNVIEAAKAAGVEHIVYTSATDARESALILAPEHKATEEAIEASGIPATILRNGWYSENYTRVYETAVQTGEVVASVGDGRVSSASRKDYAEAAAVVLSEPGHIGRVYELSGDTAWDFAELAATIARIAGTPVVYRPLTADEHSAELATAGLDAGTIGFIVGLDQNIRDGVLGQTPGDLARLIGRPTTPLVEGLAAAV